MRHSRRLLVPACCLALATGCAEVGKLAAAAVDPPRLTFRSVAVRAVDLEGATLGFNYDVENRNSFGLDVARIKYALEVEGTRVTSGEVPGGVKLPARGTAPLTFTTRLRFKDVPGIVQLLGKRDTIAYKLSGDVGVQTPLGVLDVPISHQDHVPLPHVPRFSLEGLRIRSLSLSRLSLEVRVRVANPNPFPLPAGKLDSVLWLGGAQVARADGRALAALSANDSAVVGIPVELDLGAAGRAAGELARGAPVEVRLQGAADVAGMKLPLDLGARLPAR